MTKLFNQKGYWNEPGGIKGVIGYFLVQIDWRQIS